MLSQKIGYSYNDVTIIPEVISDIKSRSECNAFIPGTDNILPIFTAPMASVVSDKNYKDFYINHITPVIPRNINLEIRKELMLNNIWIALSLKEFKDLFIDNADKLQIANYYICVDIANGHMKHLYELCKLAKDIASKNYQYTLTIMTGNIANPDTYEYICKYYGKYIDYIRVGIGGGSGCLTTSNVSIHYPQATLINECYKIKKELESEELRQGAYDYYKKYDYELPKIIADGGIRNYDHVIKALALGADYVMIGSLFAQCIESAGEKEYKNLDNAKVYTENYRNLSIDENHNWSGYYTDNAIESLLEPWKDILEKKKKEAEEKIYPHAQSNYEYEQNKYKEKLQELQELKFIGHIDVKFFGMASADGQKSISGEKTKTSEGLTKYLPVKYTLSNWVDNMISYLHSAMSYCNCKMLYDFIGTPKLIPNSISEIQAVNK